MGGKVRKGVRSANNGSKVFITFLGIDRNQQNPDPGKNKEKNAVYALK
jgi:hypothetical protein